MTQFSRALFLDFDGVLHPSGGPPGHSLPFSFLDEFVRELDAFPDVAVVAHSSWVERFSTEEIREFLAPLDTRLLGTVDTGAKASAIMSFVSRHPEIRGWLVLDDDPTEFPEDFPGAVLICDPSTGVEGPHARSLLRKWLRSGWSTLRSTTEPP